MEIYVVKPGDSVDSIAQQLDANAEQIIFDNQLEYPYPLAVGQALLINRFVRNASRAITVSGYAYPFIDREGLIGTSCIFLWFYNGRRTAAAFLRG